jgi:hypothetical protein
MNKMLNMKDIMNVRESYSKKMLEESDYSEDRKYGLLMMMGEDQPNKMAVRNK